VVKDAEEPDLTKFKWKEHDAIILDQVNRAQFILDNRGVLQSNNLTHSLGGTKTNMFAYEVYCHRTPFVLTFDADVSDFDHLFATKDWLRSNCVVVEVGTPLYLS